MWGLPPIGLAVAAVLLFTARRRTAAPAPDPELAPVPLQITGLSKKYKGGERYSVKDLSFRVEQGQVLGLLGPNGAGKTTTLRMLMGLIAPDEGEIRVFGQAIRPGAPVLSRVGAFVEGAGFLPHLSGRENLDLYWKATGRPAGDAHVDEALRIANLGGALERAVRTYSQGMRQRLALAQAMLGLPDLLILDEPTNGLDPPQIREMREVMIRYAAGAAPSSSPATSWRRSSSPAPTSSSWTGDGWCRPGPSRRSPAPATPSSSPSPNAPPTAPPSRPSPTPSSRRSPPCRASARPPAPTADSWSGSTAPTRPPSSANSSAWTCR